jgi:L-rhamnose mutarotase
MSGAGPGPGAAAPAPGGPVLAGRLAEGARPPRRVASVVCLVPEMEAEYRRLHAQVWPEVLAALRAAEVTNYSIFLRDGMLYSYLEYTGDDYEAAMAKVAADPATQRWWKLTGPCQRPVATAAPGEWWAPAEELFHMD